MDTDDGQDEPEDVRAEEGDGGDVKLLSEVEEVRRSLEEGTTAGDEAGW